MKTTNLDGDSSNQAPSALIPENHLTMAGVGWFKPFNLIAEDWDSYVTRFQFYIDPANQQATFFSVYGRVTFNVAQAILVPLQLPPTDFNTIIERLKDHLSPQPSEIACQHAFYMQEQAPGEMFSGSATVLQKVARSCNFTELEKMLQDRLVALCNKRWLFPNTFGKSKSGSLQQRS